MKAYKPGGAWGEKWLIDLEVPGPHRHIYREHDTAVSFDTKDDCERVIAQLELRRKKDQARGRLSDK